jgi:SAM-dependent methyltransferase
VNSVLNHYETHLAPIYVWMAGGMEHALSLGSNDLAPFLERPGVAVNLGAGFGMHSIPLARAGHQVLAVDTSRLLLAELRRHGEGLDVTAIEADLLDFAAHLRRPAGLILCMGDTLTHLQSTSDVERLLRSVAGALRPDGRFVATFRDYRDLPMDDRRFISVRSDSKRIHTCFLEAMEERVRVHDIIHERVHDAWAMKVSSYEKLRLAPEAVLRAAEGLGMRCRIEPGPRGMVMIVADAPSGISDQGCR